MVFTKRSAAYSEVLSESKYESAFYLTVTCNYAVTRHFFFVHTEVIASVLYENIHFNKAVFVEENV